MVRRLLGSNGHEPKMGSEEGTPIIKANFLDSQVESSTGNKMMQFSRDYYPDSAQSKEQLNTVRDNQNNYDENEDGAQSFRNTVFNPNDKKYRNVQ